MESPNGEEAGAQRRHLNKVYIHLPNKKVDSMMFVTADGKVVDQDWGLISQCGMPPKFEPVFMRVLGVLAV